MGLDLGKLKNLQEDLVNKTEKGDGNLVYANKMKDEMEIRILPPVAELNGVYFLEQIIYWINKKPYMCDSTFGLPSIFEEEVEAAKALNDKDINAMLEDDKIFKAKKSQYILPILQLSCDFDENWVLKSCGIIDNKPKILVCTSQMMKAINREVTGRFVQPDITDRIVGHNITLSKEGSGLDTTYNAKAWPTKLEMDSKWYTDTMVPNIVKFAESVRLTEEYQRGIIRNFLYGEAMPNKDSQYYAPRKNSATTSEPQKANRPSTPRPSFDTPAAQPAAKAAPVAAKEATPVAKAAAKLRPRNPEPEDAEIVDESQPEPKVAAKQATPAPAAKRSRNLLDDVQDVD